MIIKKINDNEFFKLKERWDYLVIKNETNSVFLSFDWMCTWWKHNNHGKELYVLVAIEKDIIGIAPLMKSKGFMSKIEFIGTPESDYTDFITPYKKRHVIKKFYDYLIQNEPGSYVKLSEIPEFSSTITITNDILNKRYQIPFCNYTSYIDIDKIGKLKKAYRKKFRRLKKQGEVNFEQLSKQESKELLDTFVIMHKENWATRKQKGLFLLKTQINWFEELIEKDLLRFWVLNINTVPISIRGVLQWQGSRDLFAHAMSENHRRLAPGTNSLMMIESIGDKIGFGRGKESYKKAFVKNFEKNMSIEIYPNLLIQNINRPLNKLRKKIMDRPGLHKRLVQIRDRFELMIGKV